MIEPTIRSAWCVVELAIPSATANRANVLPNVLI